MKRSKPEEIEELDARLAAAKLAKSAAYKKRLRDVCPGVRLDRARFPETSWLAVGNIPGRSLGELLAFEYVLASAPIRAVDLMRLARALHDGGETYADFRDAFLAPARVLFVRRFFSADEESPLLRREAYLVLDFLSNWLDSGRHVILSASVHSPEKWYGPEFESLIGCRLATLTPKGISEAQWLENL